MWRDKEEKLLFQHALIWHLATSAMAAATDAAISDSLRQPKAGFVYNAPVRPDTNACHAFNEGSCTDATTHPD